MGSCSPLTLSSAGGCISKELGMPPGRSAQTEFLITRRGSDAALGRAVEVTLHDQVGFVHFLEGVGFLADGHGERAEANRAAAKFDDNRFENPFVHLVESVPV